MSFEKKARWLTTWGAWTGAAALLGVLEALLLPGRTALAVLVGAALGALTGFLVGAFAALVGWLLGRLGPARRVAELWHAHTSPAADDRQPVVRFCAALCALLVAVVVAIVAGRFALRLLADVQDAGLKDTLTLAALGGAIVLACALFALLAWGLRRPVAAVDRFRPLPWPHAAWARQLVFVTLPVVAVTLGVIARNIDALGWLIGFVATLPALLALALQLARPWPTSKRGALSVFLALELTAVLLMGVAAWRSHAAVRATASTGLGLLVAQRATDFDRDGVSAVFETRDCAPFDARRRPGVPDVPGNGVDEDCDGSDAVAESGKSAVPERRFLGASSQVKVQDYNVVWVVIDALRADHTGFMGYERPTTPRLDALARDSIRFDNAFSQSSATALSIPSMLVGKYPAAMSWTLATKRLQPAKEHRSMAERFKGKGYSTALIANAYFRFRFPGLQQGFDRVVDAWSDSYGKRRFRDTSAPITVTRAIDFIETSKAPFFAMVYFEEPHAPYKSASPHVPRFGKQPIDRYDTDVGVMDLNLGFLLDYLQNRGRLWERTLLIVTADHGEEFGEHGGRYHARTCNVESTHVPLLLRIPGLPGGTVDQNVALVDIAPTLIELTGMKVDAAELHGQSLLVPALDAEAADRSRPIFCSVVSQRAQDAPFFRRSARVGAWALQEDTLSKGAELFDLKSDPTEKTNVAGANAGLVAELRRHLAATYTGNLRDHSRM